MAEPVERLIDRPEELPRPQRSSTSVCAYWNSQKQPVLLGLTLVVVSIAAAWVQSELLWLVIGGSVLTIAGIPLTFLRLMQRGAAGVDDPTPPPSIPVGRAVRFNDFYFYDKLERLYENFSVLTGVAYLVAGALLAGVVAPIAQMIRD